MTTLNKAEPGNVVDVTKEPLLPAMGAITDTIFESLDLKMRELESTAGTRGSFPFRDLEDQILKHVEKHMAELYKKCFNDIKIKNTVISPSQLLQEIKREVVSNKEKYQQYLFKHLKKLPSSVRQNIDKELNFSDKFDVLVKHKGSELEAQYAECKSKERRAEDAIKIAKSNNKAIWVAVLISILALIIPGVSLYRTMDGPSGAQKNIHEIK